jgi:hypothetical protein
MTSRLYLYALGALTLPVIAVALFFGSGAADPPPAGDMVCTVVIDSAPTGEASGAGAVHITGEQVENARIILGSAKALGMPQQAGVIAIMTAYQESKLLVLGNPSVPESLALPYQGLGSDRDSVGTFQQRPSMDWGSVGQLMHPATAAMTFLRALAGVPGWQDLPAWQAAQEVQASADGTRYAQWESLARAITVALWDGSCGTLQCATTGTTVTGPGGAFAPEACSVRPDPTTGRGCLTPRMLNIATQLMAQGWTVSCWDEHAWNPRSDHPLGRACDAFPGPGGRMPTAAQKARGDALASSLQASASETGMSYLIWYGRHWSVGRGDEGWRPYKGGGVYDPVSVTGGHFDHLHISVY